MSERYEILDKIGQGGRGSVYRAIDVQLKREVAIKRISVPDGATPDEIERIGEKLMREALAMSALNHSNIVTIYDVVKDDEGGFVVMELLNGDTLHDVVKRNVLTLEDFREVAQQTLEALMAAEEQNMLHRDLKPGNIMLAWLPSSKFQVKILDFGLAKISEQPSLQTVDHGRSIAGSIHFMAPEQFELRELTAATDLYAIGCVYYFCLTGTYPFGGDSMAKVMTAHLQGTYEPLDQLRPDLPPDLCQWVMWLMNREMEHRPQSAREALERLPLATTKTGHVYAVAPVEPIPVVPQRPKLITGPVSSPPTGRVTGRVPNLTTGRVPAAPPGKVPGQNTGRVSPMANTGRIPPLASPPPTHTGRVRVPQMRSDPEPALPAARAAPVAAAPDRSFDKRWLFILLVIPAALLALLVTKVGPARDNALLRDQFTGRSGALAETAPTHALSPLAGRQWVATSGLDCSPNGLLAKAGNQTATLEIAGSYSTSDTIRITLGGLRNPESGWIGFGLSPKPAPGLNSQDLTGWVNLHGDKNPNPGSGGIHQLGWSAKNVSVPRGPWRTGADNHAELLLNCRNGEALLYLNGNRAAAGELFSGGMHRVPPFLVLTFGNTPGAVVREMAFENLGRVELFDLEPTFQR